MSPLIHQVEHIANIHADAASQSLVEVDVRAEAVPVAIEGKTNRQVGGFDLGGKPSGYYTTAESIVEKMKRGDKVLDYYAEPIMHELLSESDFGKYQDKTTSKMQLCFLTNNDITGGNSGSPMFMHRDTSLALR